MRIPKLEYDIADRHVKTRKGTLLSRSYKLTGTWEGVALVATCVLLAAAGLIVAVVSVFVPERYELATLLVALAVFALATLPHVPWRVIATRIMGRRVTLWGPKN